jgi:UDP-sugar transporter A1/2/3
MERLPDTYVKGLVLTLLTCQNACAAVLMRATRSLPGQTDFVPQTAVLMQETVKMLLCGVLLVATGGSISSVWAKRDEALKTGVPALFYLVQNNLNYAAAGLVEPPVYAVLYQTRLIWVGLCSVLILGRALQPTQWIAIVLTAIGISIVNLSMMQGGEAKVVSRSAHILGGLLVLVAALCASLAGVSFEKLLKGAEVDLWTRNLQLAFFSLLCGTPTLLLSSDGTRVMHDGFFQGYTMLTWVCILSNSIGGLLAGMCIKYANAIVKDMSLAFSVCLSSVASILLFGFRPNAAFCAGVPVVLFSSGLYSGSISFAALLPETKYTAVAASTVDDEENKCLKCEEVGKTEDDNGNEVCTPEDDFEEIDVLKNYDEKSSCLNDEG